MSNDGKNHEVEVHFRDIPEAEKTHFKMADASTLQAAWDEAYVQMEITKGQNDVLQTADDKPKAMANYLGLTLKALKDQKIVENYNFEIVAGTGGA
jgi:hypothetical protein